MLILRIWWPKQLEAGLKVSACRRSASPTNNDQGEEEGVEEAGDFE